ncbi:MAG: hypothetical protein ACQCN5_01400 [Candidatus Bathyarchaeia archaeon]
MDNQHFILLIGSVIALLLGGLSAFVPGLAYITVTAEWSNFLLPNAPHFVTIQPLSFSFNDFTVKLLVSSFGGLLGLFSVCCEHKNTVPFLSFAGLSFGTIGFLLPYGSNQVLTDYAADVPWVGSLITLVGVMLMFLGFALKNEHVPKWALLVIPVLLIIYLISPVLIFTGNLELFVFLQVNISISTTIGILVLFSHLLIVWAGITGLRMPEKETANVSKKITPKT